LKDIPSDDGGFIGHIIHSTRAFVALASATQGGMDCLQPAEEKKRGCKGTCFNELTHTVTGMANSRAFLPILMGAKEFNTSQQSSGKFQST